MMDRLYPPVGVETGALNVGDRVRVVKLPGCPRPGTMGQYYIAHPETGDFFGMVCENSLIKE